MNQVPENIFKEWGATMQRLTQAFSTIGPQVGAVNSPECCFDFTVTTVTQSGRVPREQGTFGFSFINKGDTDVTVNQIILKGFPPGFPDLSGESFSYFDQYSRTLGNPNFDITFDALVTVRQLQIIQFYKKTSL